MFLSDDYDRLRRWCDGLPPIEAVPVLTGGELLRCMQWDAPARIFGVCPADIQLERDLLLAASEGEVSDAAAVLEDAIRETGGESRVWLTPSPPTARAVTLYVDTAGTPEWTPLCIIDDHIRLAPLPGHLAGSDYHSGPIHKS